MAQQAPAPEPALTQEGSRLHLDALGHRLSMPLPNWLTPAERLSPTVVELVEANRYGDARQAFVEFFPKGQSLENWQATYAARIILEPDRSLEDYQQAALFGYSQPCQPEATGAFTFGEKTADSFPALGFICGAFRDDLSELRGQGEVVVIVFHKSAAGVAVVYQEWRGPAFNPADPATWPVDAKLYQARAAELQAQSHLRLRPGD